jgi:hypothetical protein
MTLAKARIVNYDHNSSFIVLATVIMSINYDRKTFIVQATSYHSCDIIAMFCFLMLCHLVKSQLANCTIAPIPSIEQHLLDTYLDRQLS